MTASATVFCGSEMRIPLRFIRGEDLPLCVIADVTNVDIAADIELLRTELRHGAGGSG